MVKGESTGSYSGGNELHHAQEFATEGPKNPNLATSCRCNDKKAQLLRHLGCTSFSRMKGGVGQ